MEEETEELTDTESENDNEETSDDEEVLEEETEELTDTESENDNEDGLKDEHDESVNQIFEDFENNEDDSEEHHNEIINQIFEDRNNKSDNADEEDFEEADLEDEDSDDEYDEEIPENNSIFRKKIIAAVLASVLALTVSAGGIFYFVNKIKNNHQNNSAINTSNEEQAELGALENNSGDIQLNDNDSGLSGGTGNNETNPTQSEASDNGMLTLSDNTNQEADDQNPSNPDLNTSVPLNISKSSWAVAPYIASDPEFKPFLQQSGHAIQADIRQKLSSVTDNTNPSNVKVQITVKDNSADEINVLKSSGSKQIDEIVLQSVKDYIANNQIPKLSDNAIQSLKKSNKDKKFKITFSVNF